MRLVRTALRNSPMQWIIAVKTMYDLLVLAYRANVTRVTTYMVARETSNRTYPQLGVPDGHHEISHHQNIPENIKKTEDVPLALTTTPTISGPTAEAKRNQQVANPVPIARIRVG